MDNFEVANSAGCSAEIIALRGPDTASDKDWAKRHLQPDLSGSPRSAAWLADMAQVIGGNLARNAPDDVVRRLGPLRWPEYFGQSPYELTYAVARCLGSGGKVRALAFLADVPPSDRAFFMVRLADAMGEATRGREHQL